jgi:ribosomal protein S18 acetylase RimI-like enzyme
VTVGCGGPCVAAIARNTLSQHQLTVDRSIPMNITERDVPIPDGAHWVALTDEVLACDEFERWVDLAERFEPQPHDAGVEMAEWLQECVRGGSMPLETWAICREEELLGFYAIRPAAAEFPTRWLPILDVRRVVLKRPRLKRGLQPGCMLSSIVRSKDTERGFGRILVEHAIGRTRSDERNVALFVEPANDTVARMWEREYHFMSMDESAPHTRGVLWFPVDPCPEGDWP